MNEIAVIVVALVVGIVIGGAVAYILQRKSSSRLRQHFGPEYTRTVEQTGDRRSAEARLKQRKDRVERFHIRVLDQAERERFSESWRGIQARFIDDPNGTLVEADQLIGSVMSAKGYPVQDFDQRAADVSVDHPSVVQNYREGHQIAVKHGRGSASTEDLRRAMIHYRVLFDDLLGQPEYADVGGKRT